MRQTVERKEAVSRENGGSLQRQWRQTAEGVEQTVERIKADSRENGGRHQIEWRQTAERMDQTCSRQFGGGLRKK